METEIKENRRLATSSVVIDTYRRLYGEDFVWSEDDVDLFEIKDLKEYREAVTLSRFFYKRDPIASTVINKIIDIGINDIEFFKEDLTANEFKIMQGIKEQLLKFAEQCTLEYLLTGLVIPEFSYKNALTTELKKMGIKKLETISIPSELWIRDSGSIIINKTVLSGKSSYFVEVPDDLAFFIKTKGTYQDGTKDIKLYEELLVNYPEFVAAVEAGETKILLENPVVIERRKTADSAYPIPYLYPALEALKFKRNLRKMDYSIASRVIAAIMLITLGNDDYPLTEDDQSTLDSLKTEMRWRDGSGKNYERIYQLFGNHTLNIKWIVPPIEALINDAKYKDINLDILFALGFPRILLTGETERSGSSDAEYAMISPLRTIEFIRKEVFSLVEKVVNDICKLNNIQKRVNFRFAPVNLHDAIKVFDMLFKLYETANISRESLSDALGYNIRTEFDKRVEENKLIKELGIENFSPLPHSNTPEVNGQGNEQKTIESKSKEGNK